MKTKLTDEDIKILKYELRSGLLFALFFAVFGIAGTILYYADNDINSALFVFVGTMVFCGMLYYLINRKKLTDISNKEKLLEIKTLEKKISRTDWEVGSGSVAKYQEMKPFDLYNFFIDGVKYTVEKELYEACDAGDELVFHIAPKSKHLLKIEKNNKNI